MNTRSNRYYILRSVIRFVFAFLVTAALVIGVPLAVEAVWPALVLSAILWAIVLYPHAKAFHQRGRLRLLANAG